MNLKKIHHVAIIVSDYKKSREFYVEKLGFRVIRENYRPEREDYKLDLELDGCEPVSYTHLDVYKRQDIDISRVALFEVFFIIHLI